MEPGGSGHRGIRRAANCRQHAPHPQYLASLLGRVWNLSSKARTGDCYMIPSALLVGAPRRQAHVLKGRILTEAPPPLNRALTTLARALATLDAEFGAEYPLPPRLDNQGAG